MVLLLAAAAACAGCGVNDDWSPEDISFGTSRTEDAVLRRGRAAYTMYCIGCHGENGDGEGPAARFMSPKPRDFRKGRLKFASVPAGDLPLDDDLARTITKGLHGTSMPAFPLLSLDEKTAIVAYVKTFSPVWQKSKPGAAVAIKADPWRKRPEAGVAEGERVYHGLGACSSCHAAYAPKKTIVEAMAAYTIEFSGFRPDLYESVEKDSDWGAPIKPPNFLVDRIKSASTKGDLVRVIAAGIGGTAMPSWAGSLTNEQLWGLAYYVDAIASLRGTPEAVELQKSLAEQPPYEPPTPH